MLKSVNVQLSCWLSEPKRLADRRTNQPIWRAIAMIISKYCHFMTIYASMLYIMLKKTFLFILIRRRKEPLLISQKLHFFRGDQMYGKLEFFLESAKIKNLRKSVAGEIRCAKTDFLGNAKNCAIFPCANFPFLKYFFEKKNQSSIK